MKPRGVRNHNPTNLERGIKWQGLAKPHEMTPEQKAEDRFAVFRSPEWGIRAAAKIIQTYRTKYGLTTVANIIGRWAPAFENDVNSYAHAVAQAMGVPPDAQIDTADPDVLAKMIEAMIRHENGTQPYSEATIRAGIALAGLGPESETAPKPVSKSKRVKGAAATAAAGGAVTVIDQATGLLSAAQRFVTNLTGVDVHEYPVPLIVLGVAALAFIVYVGWTVVVDYRDEREPEEVV